MLHISFFCGVLSERFIHNTHVYMCIENCIDAYILIMQSATIFTVFSTIINTHTESDGRNTKIFFIMNMFFNYFAGMNMVIIE